MYSLAINEPSRLCTGPECRKSVGCSLCLSEALYKTIVPAKGHVQNIGENGVLDTISTVLIGRWIPLQDGNYCLKIGRPVFQECTVKSDKILSAFCRYYDVEVGKGPEAGEGARVAVHYDAYWKGITFMTSRQVSPSQQRSICIV